MKCTRYAAKNRKGASVNQIILMLLGLIVLVVIVILVIVVKDSVPVSTLSNLLDKAKAKL